MHKAFRYRPATRERADTAHRSYWRILGITMLKLTSECWSVYCTRLRQIRKPSPTTGLFIMPNQRPVQSGLGPGHFSLRAKTFIWIGLDWVRKSMDWDWPGLASPFKTFWTGLDYRSSPSGPVQPRGLGFQIVSFNPIDFMSGWKIHRANPTDSIVRLMVVTGKIQSGEWIQNPFTYKYLLQPHGASKAWNTLNYWTMY